MKISTGKLIQINCVGNEKEVCDIVLLDDNMWLNIVKENGKCQFTVMDKLGAKDREEINFFKDRSKKYGNRFFGEEDIEKYLDEKPTLDYMEFMDKRVHHDYWEWDCNLVSISSFPLGNVLVFEFCGCGYSLSWHGKDYTLVKVYDVNY